MPEDRDSSTRMRVFLAHLQQALKQEEAAEGGAKALLYAAAECLGARRACCMTAPDGPLLERWARFGEARDSDEEEDETLSRRALAGSSDELLVYGLTGGRSCLARILEWHGERLGACLLFYDELRNLSPIEDLAFSLVCSLLTRERDRERAVQQQEKYGAFFSSSLDGILIHDLAGRIIDANPGAEKMFGFPRERLLSMHLTRLAPAEFAHTVREGLREVRSTGYNRREIMMRRMDGALFPAEIVSSRFECGGESRVHGIVRDISQRRKAQNHAAERDLRFRKVFEQSLDGILLQDDEGVVVEANGTMSRMLGAGLEEIIGLNFGELHPAKDREERQRFFQQIQALGESRYECEFRRLDGSLFPAEVAASSFDQGGRRYVQKFVRDISAHREAEAEIRRAAEEAERANQIKSVFLATMSHEIRTPLNGIIGFARLLDEGPLDEGQRQHVEMVKTSGNILLTLINDILDFSRIESGKLDLDESAFSPARLLTETLALHLPTARAKNLYLTHSAPLSGPHLVRGDAGRLRQVMMNLLSNAVKFTETGGVHAGLTVEDSKRLVFSIRDTGPGFTPEEQRQLFEPFYQTDLSATRKHGGTGLGLAISRRLMEAMGGGIEARRHPDGAEFRFWLPLVEVFERAAVRSVAPGPSKALAQQGLRVLVAEDQAINARLIRLMLERFGLAVDIVGDGPSVLTRLARSVSLPDLVMLDMRMPGLDGVEVARRIRAGEAGPEAVHLPLVAVTANALASDRKACLDAGMDRYLSKPVTPEAIERVLLDLGLLCERAPAI